MRPLLLLMPLLLLLTGCPYYSQVPLAEVSKAPMDTLLLGTWKLDEDKPEADSFEVRIFAFNKNEYYIDMLGLSKGKIEIDRYRAYPTQIGTMRLLNLEELDRKGRYSFLRYKIVGDKMEIEIVSDDFVKDQFKTSKELSKAFSKMMTNKDFFESGLKFVRKQNNF